MTTTPEWSSTGRPKGTPSRTQQVRMTITDYIVREGLKTGKPIPPESKLMELTGASRSAVREALKVMEALGFVTIKRGAGTFVNDITLEALTTQLIFASQRDAKNGYSVLRDVVKLRAVLESSLMRLACRAENQNIDELRIIIARMEAEQRAGYVTTDTDREFHVALYKDLGNALYAPLIAALFDAYIRVPFESTIRKQQFSNAERHKALVDALESRDEEACVAAVNAHFDPIIAHLSTYGPEDDAEEADATDPANAETASHSQTPGAGEGLSESALDEGDEPGNLAPATAIHS